MAKKSTKQWRFQSNWKRNLRYTNINRKWENNKKRFSIRGVDILTTKRQSKSDGLSPLKLFKKSINSLQPTLKNAMNTTARIIEDRVGRGITPIMEGTRNLAQEMILWRVNTTIDVLIIQVESKRKRSTILCWIDNPIKIVVKGRTLRSSRWREIHSWRSLLYRSLSSRSFMKYFYVKKSASLSSNQNRDRSDWIKGKAIGEPRLPMVEEEE